MTDSTAAVDNAERAQLIADLKAARAELVARGRCAGILVALDGSVCILGAVGVALCEEFVNLDEYKQCNALYESRPYRARCALDSHLPIPWADDDDPLEGLLGFNDLAATTDQDVLDLFDKALASLGGLA